LLKSHNPALTADQIRDALTQTALDIEAPGVDRDSGYGLIMADAASAAVEALSLPTISSFTPTNGSVGISVTITGTKFENVTAVKFNGVNATFTVNSASQIAATVPATATTGRITVTTTGGTATSAASFSVVARPGNDHFANAQRITSASGTISGSNVGATKETGEPNHSGDPRGRSVWYRWTAPSNGVWIVD
jgi:hypothetical protein